ncbi:hypothetical protein COBT_000439 [Conglomerata obtusa]
MENKQINKTQRKVVIRLYYSAFMMMISTAYTCISAQPLFTLWSNANYCLYLVTKDANCLDMSYGTNFLLRNFSHFFALISTFAVFKSKLSLKNTLILNNLFYFVGNFIFLYAPNTTTLFIGQIFIGIGVGVSCAIIPIYLYELAPINRKAFFLSFFAIGSFIGKVCGDALSTVHSNFIAITLNIIGTCIIEDVDYSVISQESKETVLSLLKSSEARKNLILTVLAHLSQHLLLLKHIIFEGFATLQYAYKGWVYLFFSVWAWSINTTAFSFIADFIGRKPILLTSFAVLTVSSVLNWFEYFHQTAKLSFLFGYNIGIATIPLLMPFECFHSQSLIPALNIAVAAKILSELALNYYEYKLPLCMFQANAFVIFSLIIIISGMIFYFALKESKPKDNVRVRETIQ